MPTVLPHSHAVRVDILADWSIMGKQLSVTVITICSIAIFIWGFSKIIHNINLDIASLSKPPGFS